MALQIRGVDIMMLPDFAAMIEGMDTSGESTGVLQAWYAGEDLDPVDIHMELSIVCFLRAQTPEAREIIERAIRRLEEAFPDELPAVDG